VDLVKIFQDIQDPRGAKTAKMQRSHLDDNVIDAEYASLLGSIPT